MHIPALIVCHLEEPPVTTARAIPTDQVMPWLMQIANCSWAWFGKKPRKIFAFHNIPLSCLTLSICTTFTFKIHNSQTYRLPLQDVMATQAANPSPTKAVIYICDIPKCSWIQDEYLCRCFHIWGFFTKYHWHAHVHHGHLMYTYWRQHKFNDLFFNHTKRMNTTVTNFDSCMQGFLSSKLFPHHGYHRG